MVNFQYKDFYKVYDLEKLVEILRAPDGCPWDMEQTHESIKRNLLEEAYEAAEAIEENDADHLKEELGDLLLQVLFHARIEQELGGFSLDDVADAVCKKLIYRHPHVFGDRKVKDADQVLTNWDELKRNEKAQKNTSDAMVSVAKNLPALWRAEKIQGKAAKQGFDWPNASGAIAKLEEELEELRQAVESGKGQLEELGDVLFSAVNVARLLGIDPEDALGSSSDKFIGRYARMEKMAENEGKSLDGMTLSEMEKLYEQSKKA
jgi:tetrapyrrole methylase family protein/MazG family protein